MHPPPSGLVLTLDPVTRRRHSSRFPTLSVTPPSPIPPMPPPPAAGPDMGPSGGEPGFWDKCKQKLNFDCGSWDDSKRKCLQSDHAFDYLISPVSSPFLNEDPRALTEIRPIFLFQTIQGSTPFVHGGNIEFFGTRARVRLHRTVFPGDE